MVSANINNKNPLDEQLPQKILTKKQTYGKRIYKWNFVKTNFLNLKIIAILIIKAPVYFKNEIINFFLKNLPKYPDSTKAEFLAFLRYPFEDTIRKLINTIKCFSIAPLCL